jgi:hypothetical protein
MNMFCSGRLVKTALKIWLSGHFEASWKKKNDDEEYLLCNYFCPDT